MNILEVRNLNKTYKDFQLKDVNLTIPKGYIMGFVGQNGAGKTSTINLINHICKCDSGSIKIDGISYADSEAIRLELQKNKILNSKFSLTKYRKELLLKDSNSLVLSSKYNSYKEKVYNLLITLEKEDRYVPYYGKPFSYYYHIIEKKNS